LIIRPFSQYYGDLGGGVGGVGARDAYVGAKRVGHGEDCVLAVLFWEWADKIQCNSIKAVVWYR
jgi:hypothetical protein